MEHYGEIRDGVLARIDSYDPAECLITERFAPGYLANLVRLDPADLPQVGQEYSGPLGDLETVLPSAGFTDPPGPTLEEARAAALAHLVEAAEEARVAPLTSGAGKLAAYERKAAEATAWQVAKDGGITPDLVDYPWIAQAVADGVHGSTGDEIAALWLALNSAWEAHAIAVESVYETAKAAIETASDQAGVQAVLDGLAWPEIPA